MLIIANSFCGNKFANSFIKCCEQLKYMVTFKDRSYVAKLVWILIPTILSTIWISSQVITAHGIPVTTTPLVVKITSPHKGQQVGIGHNLTFLGSSNYNASSKCQVSIIVDKKRPYQDTIPIGQGVDNYSQWKYTLAPAYTVLTEGVNRVTAKLTCDANPTLTKFYSINLTGINQSQPQQQIAIKSNGTTLPFFLPTSISLASAMSNSTNTPSIIPVFANSSSLIGPSSSIQSSDSSSSDHSHIHHHLHHTHHSSTNSDSGSSSSSSGHTHSGSKNHDNGNGGHSTDSHHGGGGGGHDFFHGAFSHLGQSISKSVSSHFGQ
jgi:hypothetical protein